jgi:hypothetical protein
MTPAVKALLQEAFRRGLSFNKAHLELKAAGYEGKNGYRRQNLQEYWRDITTAPILESSFRYIFTIKNMMGEEMSEVIEQITNEWYAKIRVLGTSRHRPYTEQELTDEIMQMNWNFSSPIFVIGILLVKSKGTQAAIQRRVREAVEQASIDGFEYVADCSVQQTKLCLAYLGATLSMADSRQNVFRNVGYMLSSMNMPNGKPRNNKLADYLIQIFQYVRE